MSNIYAALMAAQAEFRPALKSATNPHFKSKYADLESVLDAVEEPLRKQGVVITSRTSFSTEDGFWCLDTVLHHVESETELVLAVPLLNAKGDMQGLGSAITYARRYGLMSVCGIAPEDDDGNAASKAVDDPHAAKARQLLPRLLDALSDGDNDWIVQHILNEVPAVKSRLMEKLDKQQIAYLKELAGSV